VRSLFVVSLPRSLSTTLYHAAAHALQLREPSWTTGGEVLNRERIRGWKHRARPADARFTSKDAAPELFESVVHSLNGSVEQCGFAYKDVVQPFAVAEWLQRSDLRVLKIKRDVAEVAYAMLNRRWHYPDCAASLHDEHPAALIEGLLRAEAALARLPGETVTYPEALESHEPLTGALTALYPEATLAPIGYIDRKFVRTRARLEEKLRESALFRELQQVVVDVRATLEDGSEQRRSRLDRLSVAAST
jgi:hypothetical protein